MVIECEHGRTEAAEAAEAALRRLGAQYPGVLAFGALVAWSSCEGGRLDEARAALDPLYRLAFRLPPDPTWLTSLMAAAAVVYRLADSPAAETLTEILSPWSHVWGNSAGVSFGVTGYHLGLLSATAGDSDRAERHLYDAADRLRGGRRSRPPRPDVGRARPAAPPAGRRRVGPASARPSAHHRQRARFDQRPTPGSYRAGGIA